MQGSYTRATLVFLLAREAIRKLKMFSFKPLQAGLRDSSGKEAWMPTQVARIFK